MATPCEDAGLPAGTLALVLEGDGSLVEGTLVRILMDCEDEMPAVEIVIPAGAGLKPNGMQFSTEILHFRNQANGLLKEGKYNRVYPPGTLAGGREYVWSSIHHLKPLNNEETDDDSRTR